MTAKILLRTAFLSVFFLGTVLPGVAVAHPADCSSQTKRIRHLEKELALRPSLQEVCYEEGVVDSLHEQIVYLQNALMKGPAREVMERELAEKATLEDSITRLRADLTRLSSHLEKREREIERSREELVRREQELMKTSARVMMLEKELSTNQVPTLQRAALRSKKKVKAAAARPKRATATPRQILVLRKNLSKQLRQLNSLVLARKKLLDRVRKLKKGITISVQLPKTKSGDSLDNVRRKVKSLRSNAQATQAQGSIREIENLLQSDVAMLKRLIGGRA